MITVVDATQPPAKVLFDILASVNGVDGQHEPGSSLKISPRPSLYCEKCKAAMPVRERLLLILPDKEIFDYLCTGCGSSVGQREVTAGDKLMAQAMHARSAVDAHVLIAIAALTMRACALFLSAPVKSACRRCERC